jgi:phage terminase small subunit
MKLTPKQQLFCIEYIKDFNATQSAIRAGYSAKTAQSIGFENLTKPIIQSYLEVSIKERMENEKVNAAYVLKRLVQIDQMDVLDILNDDGTIKAVKEWPIVWRTTLSAFDVAEIGANSDNPMMLIKKIKWPDKVKNLELIGKHIDVRAWDKEKEIIDVTVSNIMPVPVADSVEDWENAAQANQDKLLKR